MKTETRFKQITAVLAVGLLAVLAVFTGCEDSGVTAPSDGNLILTPGTANIVIPEGSASGSFTFTASLFDTSGAPLEGVTIRFISSAGTWDNTEVLTDAQGNAQATLTLLADDPAEVDVQARSSSLFADGKAIKVLTANDQPRAAIIDTPLGEQEVNKVVTFDGSASTDSDGTITCYQWTIDSDLDTSDEVIQGVGASGIQKTYTAEQTLSVILRVSDSAAVGAVCNDPAPVPIDQLSPKLAVVNYVITCANTPPVAEAGNDVNAALIGSEVSVILDGRASFDPDGLIQEYRWNCGNGRPAQSTGIPGMVNCRYNAEDVYVAELSVFDNGDGTIDPNTGDFACKKSSIDTTTVTVTRP